MQSLSYNKVGSVSRYLLSAVVKVKTGRVAWVQNGGRLVDGGRSPAGSRGSLGRQLAAVLTSIMREDRTASSGKDRNSESEVRFLLDAYWFLTIAKPNNPGSSIPSWDRLYIHAACASSVAVETYFLLGVMVRSV